MTAWYDEGRQLVVQSTDKPWEPIFSRIRAIYHPEWRYPPLTTAADLEAAERELCFHFPRSYCAFAMQFGLWGILGEALVEILALSPRFVEKSQRGHSVIEDTRDLQSHEWREFGTQQAAALHSRGIVFAIDPGYHTFVFDPVEITDPGLHEYRICELDRTDTVHPVADSFTGWLQWIDRVYRFRPTDEVFHHEGLFPLVVKPDSLHPDPIPYLRHASVKRKKKPGKRRVKLWLAWNEGIVGKLARTIRDQGATDTFPILGDALEEAGCTNKDMLYSCRQGDPDIDGVWVLQILLGPKTEGK